METTLGRVLFNENVEQTLRDYLGDAMNRFLSRHQPHLEEG